MYLSGYLKQNQAEYYRRLTAIRDEGEWESWLTFFLQGVVAAAGEAERGIINIASLIAEDRKRLINAPTLSTTALRLFELLPMMPRFTIISASKRLNVTLPTASAATKVLEDLEIVNEKTGLKKNRIYSYWRYIEMLKC
jgi:Fic family protein